MRYTLLVYESPEDFRARSEPAEYERYWGAYLAYAQALREAGVLVSGTPLHGPELATTVRVMGDRREVQDGPFADSKAQLAGYIVIEVADLDAALAWAARCPGAGRCAVEVRPDHPGAPSRPTLADV